MTEWWAVSMLITGGLFAGGVASIAWERVPAWRTTDVSGFTAGFAQTLRRVDRLQPALLTLCLVSTVGFALSSDGAPRTLAAIAAAGFLAVLIGSVAVLVPIQRRLVRGGSEQSVATVERLRARWLRGHEIRTIVALLFFVMAAVAAAM